MPEISVTGAGVNIADGDDSPTSDDDTAFGTITQGDEPLERIFTVTNTGDATLETSDLSLPEGFTLAEELSASIAPGESDSFTVRLDSDTPGTKSGEVSFANNDDDENPFNFSVTGTVEPPPPPAEIS